MKCFLCLNLKFEVYIDSLRFFAIKYYLFNFIELAFIGFVTRLAIIEIIDFINFKTTRYSFTNFVVV